RAAEARLGRPADPRLALRRRGALRVLPALGEPHPRPDAAARAVRAAQLHVRERRDARRVRRPLHLRLLPGALPPAARRLLAAPERARDRADPARDVRALAALRPPLDASRPADLHGRRPAGLRGRAAAAHAALARRRLLARPPPRDPRLRPRARDDCRAADL